MSADINAAFKQWVFEIKAPTQIQILAVLYRKADSELLKGSRQESPNFEIECVRATARMRCSSKLAAFHRRID